MTPTPEATITTAEADRVTDSFFSARLRFVEIQRNNSGREGGAAVDSSFQSYLWPCVFFESLPMLNGFHGTHLQEILGRSLKEGFSLRDDIRRWETEYDTSCPPQVAYLLGKSSSNIGHHRERLIIQPHTKPFDKHVNDASRKFNFVPGFSQAMDEALRLKFPTLQDAGLCKERLGVFYFPLDDPEFSPALAATLSIQDENSKAILPWPAMIFRNKLTFEKGLKEKDIPEPFETPTDDKPSASHPDFDGCGLIGTFCFLFGQPPTGHKKVLVNLSGAKLVPFDQVKTSLWHHSHHKGFRKALDQLYDAMTLSGKITPQKMATPVARSTPPFQPAEFKFLGFTNNNVSKRANGPLPPKKKPKMNHTTGSHAVGNATPPFSTQSSTTTSPSQNTKNGESGLKLPPTFSVQGQKSGSCTGKSLEPMTNEGLVSPSPVQALAPVARSTPPFQRAKFKFLGFTRQSKNNGCTTNNNVSQRANAPLPLKKKAFSLSTQTNSPNSSPAVGNGTPHFSIRSDTTNSPSQDTKYGESIIKRAQRSIFSIQGQNSGSCAGENLEPMTNMGLIFPSPILKKTVASLQNSTRGIDVEHSNEIPQFDFPDDGHPLPNDWAKPDQSDQSALQNCETCPKKLIDSNHIETIPDFESVRPILEKAGYKFHDGLYCYPGFDQKMNPKAEKGKHYFDSQKAFRTHLCENGIVLDNKHGSFRCRGHDKELAPLDAWVCYHRVEDLLESQDLRTIDRIHPKEVDKLLEIIGKQKMKHEVPIPFASGKVQMDEDEAKDWRARYGIGPYDFSKLEKDGYLRLELAISSPDLRCSSLHKARFE